LEQLRLIAMRMLELDRPPSEIAKVVDRDPQTIRHWKRVWQRQGAAGLKSKPHPGRPPKFSRQQWQKFLSMLECSPKDHGYNAYLWTTALMARLVQEKFGVKLNHDYIGEMLHKLGWSCQKPTKRARERDEQAIEHWRQVVWPELLKKAGSSMR
jgi:transposase